MYVWNRDGGKCVKCGSQEKLEFDHIIPLSKGGSNTARNVQLLCETCNRSKGDSIVWINFFSFNYSAQHIIKTPYQEKVPPLMPLVSLTVPSTTAILSTRYFNADTVS